jgi:cytochrome c556
MMMKKFLLMSVLVSGVLFAEGVLNQGQMKTMQTLEEAMETIQKGFLYNNENVVATGVKDLNATLVDVNAFVIKVSEKDKKKDFDPKTYAVTATTAIAKMVGEIETLYKDGKHDEALEVYTKVLNRCVVCHKIIRKW